jgi:hypothetical protein
MGQIIRWLFFSVVVLFCMVLFSGTAMCKWVPDDEGNKYWWDPPQSSVQQIFADPGILTQNNAEVLFLMDTSGSMSDEFSALCGKINDIVQGLQNKGINLEYKILGITQQRNCTNGTVKNSVSNPTVNHSEDWGPAVEDVANQYPWKSGYARIAMPMSDEGAENGDRWDAADDTAIDRAKNAAKNNSVGVIPVVCSGYNQNILQGATELAENCWGSVFISTDPAGDLVDGIINAINQIFDPVSDKLDAQIFVDDAWASANVCGSINKIAGDIAFLVAQVLNGDDKKDTVDLEITYPSDWHLALHNPVMKRNTLVSEEEKLNTEELGTQTTPGKVVIKNVEVPAKGQSKQYLVKLIIPETEIANTSHVVGAKIVSSSVQTNSILATEDAFQIKIKNSGDIILTNRHLLINHFVQTTGDVQIVEDILKQMHQITYLREAVVFYVDRWDEYDDFAKDKDGMINTWGTTVTPIKIWDRSGLDYENHTETSLNAVPVMIDRYIHYWADQLGGKTNRKNLLIIGDDTVIPYYRARNPAAGIGCPGADCWDLPSHEYGGGPTQHYSDAADANYVFTDNLYADTDGEDWGEGGVDHMHVGRVVGENADQMLRFLKNITSDTVKPPHADNTVISCGPHHTDNLKDSKAEKRFSDVGYTVFDSYTENDTTTSFTTKGWDAEDIIKAFRHGQDAWAYRGHGSNRGGQGFKGSDFDNAVPTLDGTATIQTSELFKTNYPMLFMHACNMGIADIEGDINESNDTLFVYKSIVNNIDSLVAAQSLTSASFNDEFLNQILKQVTGSRFWWSSNTVPESIGYSQNNAKRKATEDRGIHHLQQFSYLLYGAPWKTLRPPNQQGSQSMMYGMQKTFNETQTTGKITQSAHTLSKTIQESISDYQITSSQGFDFVTIDGYEQLKQGMEDTPVVPVKRFEINVPLDATNINIMVNRANPLELGSLNIPVYIDGPPVIGEPVNRYAVAPDTIGLYENSHFWFRAKELNHMAVMVDMIPVSYDTATGNVVLYRDVEIEVSYDTEQNGVLLEAPSNALNYNTGDTIIVSAYVENTGTRADYFDVTVELQDSMRKTVESKSASHQIASGNIAEIPFQLTAPAKGGNYWIETTLFRNTLQIGRSLQQININPGAITNFDISKSVPGSAAQFSVTFENQSSSAIEAAFSLYIYSGSIEKAEFLPKVYNIPAGARQTANFSWNIPADFPEGNYLAVASVTSDGYAASVSERFDIGVSGNLEKGWNLVSLYQQPADTSVDKVLEPIIDRVEAVWAYVNSSWLFYVPDEPGFSDLSDMTSGYGYWLKMKTASPFSVTGTNPGNSIALDSGWNLVGYNSAAEQPIADALSSISGKVISAWGYEDGEWKLYDPTNPGFSDLDMMTPGFGYWINTSGSCIWTLP